MIFGFLRATTNDGARLGQKFSRSSSARHGEKDAQPFGNLRLLLNKCLTEYD